MNVAAQQMIKVSVEETGQVKLKQKSKSRVKKYRGEKAN